jgi:hypothetical protein
MLARLTEIRQILPLKVVDHLLVGKIKIVARHVRIPKWMWEQHTFLEAKSIDDFRAALVAADPSEHAFSACCGGRRVPLRCCPFLGQCVQYLAAKSVRVALAGLRELNNPCHHDFREDIVFIAELQRFTRLVKSQPHCFYEFGRIGVVFSY